VWETIPFLAWLMIAAVLCAVVGFFALRWHGFTGSTLAFAVAGFLYIFARTSFVFALICILAQAVRSILASGDWERTLWFGMLTAMWLGGILLESTMLAIRILNDAYGRKGAAPYDQPRKG
jgi:hypothetical protein